MSKRSTSSEVPAPPESSVVADAATQQYGYLRCYRAVMHECGVSAAVLYGILEDYAQLGARQHRPTAPSYERLGVIMGVHRNTISALLDKLKEAGWLTWEGGKGAPLRYRLTGKSVTLFRPDVDDKEAQKLCKRSTKTVHLPAQKLCINKNTTNQVLENPPNPPGGMGVSDDDFARFWALVVRKEPSRAKALEAWRKATKTTSPEIILAGLRRWLPVWEATEDQTKIPHITTWLNEGRWDVEHPVMPAERAMTQAEMNAGGRGVLAT